MSLDTSVLQFWFNLEISSVNSWSQCTLSMTSPSPERKHGHPAHACHPQHHLHVCEAGSPAVSMLQSDVLSTKQLTVPSLQWLWLTHKPSSWSLRLAHKASAPSHTASLGASELHSSPDPNHTSSAVFAMPCVFTASCCPCLPAWPFLVSEHSSLC